jgi:hypothetical protein
MNWAQLPVNDPDGARALMTRFYRLVRASEGLALDPGHAARLEVEWWRAHRAAQHGARPGAHEELVVALRDLYAYSYETDPQLVRPAADLRAEAMEISDRWVADGCDPDDPNLAHERVLLVRSYAALLAAVHR